MQARQLKKRSQLEAAAVHEVVDDHAAVDVGLHVHDLAVAAAHEIAAAIAIGLEIAAAHEIAAAAAVAQGLIAVAQGRRRERRRRKRRRRERMRS